MAAVQHSQIKNQLLQKISPYIDQNGLRSGQSIDAEGRVLSRAVGIVALCLYSGIPYQEAADSLVDGSGDNGIDLIYYSVKDRCLFLVQSKWSSAHASSIESGDVHKFLQGVQDLVSLKFDRFNSNITSRWSKIEDALTQLLRVQLLIAYPGSGKIDQKIKNVIDDFLDSQNDTSDLFFYNTVTQSDLFKHFVKHAAAPEINIDVRLKHYGVVDAPLRAVYGQISALDLAGWFREYGTHLFSQNIRNYLGASDVNESISKTLNGDPQHFWYFNNGITILSESIRKHAIGGNDRSIGQFECKNITIVNGAQTVGTIGRSNLNADSNAFLHARIIEVSDPDSQIGQQITKASNTQNKIDARNFVALDAEQERIRTELLIDRINYEYREGEPLDSPLTGFDFIEAITALACAGDDISYVALAKGYIGGLYANIKAAPYKVLFNSSTSSGGLWQKVQLIRRIDSIIRLSLDGASPVERGVIIHGNRFIMHCILRRIRNIFAQKSFELIRDDELSEIILHVRQGVNKVVGELYPDAYPAPLYKNVQKCTKIRTAYESMDSTKVS